MPFIAVTGSYCTGKSTALDVFKYLGAIVHDIDNDTRNLYRKGSILHGKLVKHFGKVILNNRGDIDRKKLSEMAFSSRRELQVLNRLTHPPLIKLLTGFLKRQKKSDMVVVEVPLLFENRLQGLFDYTVLVTSSPVLALRRAKKKRDISDMDFKRRNSFQMPPGKKKKLADFIINNSDSKTELKRKVSKVWKKIARREK